MVLCSMKVNAIVLIIIVSVSILTTFIICYMALKDRLLRSVYHKLVSKRQSSILRPIVSMSQKSLLNEIRRLLGKMTGQPVLYTSGDSLAAYRQIEKMVQLFVRDKQITYMKYKGANSKIAILKKINKVLDRI